MSTPTDTTEGVFCPNPPLHISHIHFITTVEAIVYRSSAALTPARENYLRALYQLSRPGGGVRLTDLAHTQGVRLPTARHAVDCLRDAGLVLQETYGLITLTENGRGVARRLFDRFELTRRFLIEVLGVSESAAEREACNMEHHLDEDTLNRIAAFVTHVTNSGGDGTLRDCLLSVRPGLVQS